ncbi:hypothetical protein Taro_042615 [Colocasia esculenta]|uniref:Fungal lipase-type domain-containing protein n=1 Tax=Colocasia esculenta TaxID=4460 RepID=A0A843WZW9_COLES|nr:hypothetical protein [Colocasia esculenta]
MLTLFSSNRLPADVRQTVISSFPHYGHSGIVESSRELFMQLDGQPDDFPSENTGFLSSLLGPGCECQGYKIRIVGHSLGGAVGSVLGLRLYGRYPDVHVYSYGPPPCVDKIMAEACSDFVTSIVYNDEFSARLSVNSIIRLRAAAMTALSDNSSADSAMIYKIVRRILHVNKPQESNEDTSAPALSCQSANIVVENGNQRCRRKQVKYTVKGGIFLCSHAVSCMLNMTSHYPCKTLKDDAPALSSGIMIDSNRIDDKRGSGLTAGSGGHEEFPCREATSKISEDDTTVFNNGDVLREGDVNDTSNMVPFSGSDDLISFEDHLSVDSITSSIQVSIGETPEVFLPGLVIHIVPEKKGMLPLWNSWRIQDGKHGHRAFLANRESFKDLVITPYMFLDHLPWRCHHAMKKVLETRRAESQLDADLLNGEHII